MDKQRQEKLDTAVKMGIIPVIGEVGKEMLEAVLYVTMKLYLEKKEDVIVLINSGGGSSKCCLEIYDILGLYPGKGICGLVFGRANSAAAVILQACPRRFATPNSRILIHHGGMDMNRDLLFQEKELRAFLQKERATEAQFYQIFQKRTGKTEATIRKLCFEDREMYPAEAIKSGLLDGVWDKPLPWDPTEICKTND